MGNWWGLSSSEDCLGAAALCVAFSPPSSLESTGVYHHSCFSTRFGEVAAENSLPLLSNRLQVNQRELDGDWFQSIRDKLNWNLRNMQVPFQDGASVSTPVPRPPPTPATIFRHTDYAASDGENEDESSGKDGRALPPDTASGSPI